MTYLPKARGHAVATELDAIPWSERAHAHGRGPVERRGVTFDVRVGLGAAFGRDEAARDEARAVLFGTLFHQDTTYEATVDAVPLVIAYLADVDDDAWSKELWLWLGNVALSALLPPAKSASHGGAWGPGVRASLLASFRTSLVVMGPRDGSRFAPFASALHTATLRDEPTDAEGRTIVLAALKDLFHLTI